MSRPWLLHLPLIDFHGNLGSADEYDRPGDARATEARLSHVGMSVLGAERGTGPRIPVRLINGDLHVDGTAPPFSPERVIAALLAVMDDPQVSDEEIIEWVGPPVSPTGCGVVCDHVALGAGESTSLVLTAHVSYAQVAGRRVIVVTGLPLGVGPDAVIDTVGARVEAMNAGDPYWQPEHVGTWLLESPASGPATAIPLADIRNESYGDVIHIVCVPLNDEVAAKCAAQIVSTWGVRTEQQVQLPAPLPQLMRDLVDDDIEAQRAALNALSSAFD